MRPSPPRPRPATRRAVAACAAALALSALFIATYAAAGRGARPRDLPIAVAGEPAARAQVVRGLTEARPGAFSPRPVADAAAARAAVLGREARGAIVVEDRGVRALVAGAAGPGVAETVARAAEEVGARAGRPVSVEDLRPAPAADRGGVAPFLTQLGVLIPSLIAGAALALLAGGALGARLGLAAAFAAGAGLVAILLAGTWLGALPGSAAGLAGTAAPLAAAVAMTAFGLASALGRAGAALAAGLMLLVGNPSSGGTIPAEFLADGHRQLSPWFPSGAGVEALRNVAHFGGSGTARPLLVLAGWALAGVAAALGAAALARVRGADG